MKNRTITFVAASIFISGILSSCSSPAQKVEDAKENVANANQELDQAKMEYLADLAEYRKMTAERVAENEKSIAEFNARIADQKAEAREDYKKKIAELEQKNTDMKKRMDEYQDTGKDGWEKFKAEFSHDMEELGNAFKELTVNNVK